MQRPPRLPLGTGRRRAIRLARSDPKARGTMDELNNIHVFIEVVETGSFSAAGRKLNKSASSIARQVDQLETDLEVRLINRNTRSQSLTEAGRLYYERVRAISRELEVAKSETRSAHEGVEGRLRVALRTSSATTVIVPALPALLARYPGLELEIIVTDERPDLVVNQIDVAIWIGELPDSELVARRLSPSRRILCASPAYLEKHGTPEKPDDLLRHNCLLFRAKSYGKSWIFTRDGETETIPVRGNIASDNGLVLVGAAEQGLGLIVMPEWMVHSLLEEKRLRRVMPDYTVGPVLSPAPLYAVFPSSRSLSRRVRVFVDFLVSLFEGRLPLNG
ncbi:MAG: LysR family transcriptional regulator [Sphingomonas bacterium]